MKRTPDIVHRDNMRIGILLFALFVFVVVAGFFAVGCQSGQPLPFGRSPSPPAPETAGEHASWGTLTAMSWFAFVPAVGTLVASVWIPFLRSVAIVLLAIGLGTAASPWILERYGDAMFWPAALCIGIGTVACTFALLWPWLRLKMDASKRVRKLEEDIASESDPVKKAMDLGARTGILRLVDPKIDRSFNIRPVKEKQ